MHAKREERVLKFYTDLDDLPKGFGIRLIVGGMWMWMLDASSLEAVTVSTFYSSVSFKLNEPTHCKDGGSIRTR